MRRPLVSLKADSLRSMNSSLIQKSARAEQSVSLNRWKVRLFGEMVYLARQPYTSKRHSSQARPYRLYFLGVSSESRVAPDRQDLRLHRAFRSREDGVM